ncbi:MAG: radical SAM protein [Phycisphaerales bacterium JB038]
MPQPPTAPSVAVLLTQPQCNMICTFCVTEDNFDVLSFERAAALLEQIRAAGTRNVVLGGGEPFTWPHDLVRLAGHAKALGFTVQVATNAIALPEGFEGLECIDRFVLPLESAEPGPHNELRRYRERHHAIVLSALRKLADAGKSVTISTVATRRNVHAIPALADYLRSHHEARPHLHAWHLYRFIPEGRGGAAHADELAISEEAYEILFAGLRGRALPFRLYKRADMYQSQAVAFFSEQDGALVRT